MATAAIPAAATDPPIATAPLAMGMEVTGGTGVGRVPLVGAWQPPVPQEVMVATTVELTWTIPVSVTVGATVTFWAATRPAAEMRARAEVFIVDWGDVINE
jgi:hypothetical protein